MHNHILMYLAHLLWIKASINKLSNIFNPSFLLILNFDNKKNKDVLLKVFII